MRRFHDRDVDGARFEETRSETGQRSASVSMLPPVPTSRSTLSFVSARGSPGWLLRTSAIEVFVEEPPLVQPHRAAAVEEGLDEAHRSDGKRLREDGLVAAASA